MALNFVFVLPNSAVKSSLIASGLSPTFGYLTTSHRSFPATSAQRSSTSDTGCSNMRRSTPVTSPTSAASASTGRLNLKKRLLQSEKAEVHRLSYFFSIRFQIEPERQRNSPLKESSQIVQTYNSK